MKFPPLLWLLLFAVPALAQSPRQYISAGDKEFKDGFPQSAIFFYQKSIELDSFQEEAHFKTGEAYRATRNYKRAADHYLITTDLDGKDNYLEAHFWLAMMLKQLGRYQDAERRFAYFLDIYRQRDEFYRWARDEEKSCEWAQTHINDEPKFKVLRPDSGLNTVHAELSPTMIDSTTLWFSTVQYRSDKQRKSSKEFIGIRKAVKDSNRWELVETEALFRDPLAHIANPSFSSDSTRVYYSRCATPDNCLIYVSKIKDSIWQPGEALAEPVNEPGSISTQPAVATFGEEEYLFFATNRERGKGGMDIWFVELRNGKPKRRVRNMGSRINTAGDEITPSYDVHDSTLYFASNRMSGFGGFDLFMSKGAPGSYSTVENAGPSVNSPADDYYPTVRIQDSIGYFASNRISGLKDSENETCCNDLYKFRLLPEPIDTTLEEEEEVDSLDIVAVDSLPEILEVPVPKTIEELQAYLPITLYFHNDRPNPRTVDTTTRLSYSSTLIDYTARLGEYMVEIDKSELDEYQKGLAKQKTQDFFNYTILPSEDQLEQATAVLLRELQKGAEFELAVKGFASPLAQSDYNLNLTLRRIESMLNYFRNYEDGALMPYLDGTAEQGRLTVVKIPFGESQASQAVSDRKTNRYESIYSLEAAKERRIEILRIERTNAEEE